MGLTFAAVLLQTSIRLRLHDQACYAGMGAAELVS